jgi:hypothetical protein
MQLQEVAQPREGDPRWEPELMIGDVTWSILSSLDVGVCCLRGGIDQRTYETMCFPYHEGSSHPHYITLPRSERSSVPPAPLFLCEITVAVRLAVEGECVLGFFPRRVSERPLLFQHEVLRA